MGYAVSVLTTGMTGDVGSGLVPGLKGYGVSNRLPMEGKTDSSKQKINERKTDERKIENN